MRNKETKGDYLPLDMLRPISNNVPVGFTVELCQIISG
jgi:hypothetical protein